MKNISSAVNTDILQWKKYMIILEFMEENKQLNEAKWNEMSWRLP